MRMDFSSVPQPALCTIQEIRTKRLYRASTPSCHLLGKHGQNQSKCDVAKNDLAADYDLTPDGMRLHVTETKRRYNRKIERCEITVGAPSIIEKVRARAVDCPVTPCDGKGRQGNPRQAGLKQRFGESRVDLMAYGRTPWS
jgi:hypothetical protein